MTGIRLFWLAGLFMPLCLSLPKIAGIRIFGGGQWCEGAVWKIQGLRLRGMGSPLEDRDAPGVDRAASRSKLSRRIFRSWISSTSLIDCTVTRALSFEPELWMLEVSQVEFSDRIEADDAYLEEDCMGETRWGRRFVQVQMLLRLAGGRSDGNHSSFSFGKILPRPKARRYLRYISWASLVRPK